MDTVKFEELQLDERILRAITEMGFEEASPIQAQSIPVVMEGRDKIGSGLVGSEMCIRDSSRLLCCFLQEN